MARIDYGALRDTIKENVDLREYATKYMEPVKTKGKSYKFFCPFHPEGKTPNLVVYDQRFICQSCHKRGDIFDLFLHFEDKDSLTEAIRHIADEFGFQKTELSGDKKFVKLNLSQDEYKRFGLSTKDMREIATQNKVAHNEKLESSMKSITTRLIRIANLSMNEELKKACFESSKEFAVLLNRGKL